MIVLFYNFVSVEQLARLEHEMAERLEKRVGKALKKIKKEAKARSKKG